MPKPTRAPDVGPKRCFAVAATCAHACGYANSAAPISPCARGVALGRACTCVHVRLWHGSLWHVRARACMEGAHGMAACALRLLRARSNRSAHAAIPCAPSMHARARTCHKLPCHKRTCTHVHARPNATPRAQGEMGAALFAYPQAWAQVAATAKQRLGPTSGARVGLGINNSKVRAGPAPRHTLLGWWPLRLRHPKRPKVCGCSRCSRCSAAGSGCCPPREVLLAVVRQLSRVACHRSLL